jgi:hypothetical protein
MITLMIILLIAGLYYNIGKMQFNDDRSDIIHAIYIVGILIIVDLLLGI